MSKSVVFVITPFGEDFLALYEELKKSFSDEFEFTNGGDLDNQRSILKDIVEGINSADVIIADLTGLNPNVFYELGLAHAMNKKVIIITQDIEELPFDIKSYRVNEYSLQFNKLPKLKDELAKLLHGAVDGSVGYGNPVFDYLPDFNPQKESTSVMRDLQEVTIVNEEQYVEKDDDKGILDYISDIQENALSMSDHISTMNTDMSELNDAISCCSAEIDRAKENSRVVDVSFVRKVCRKLSEPMNDFSGKLKKHVELIEIHWNNVENGYLSLLDNSYVRSEIGLKDMQEAIVSLQDMQDSMVESDEKVGEFITVLKNTMGMERKLNRAINELILQLEAYLSMTSTIDSSIDRIVSKSQIVFL